MKEFLKIAVAVFLVILGGIIQDSINRPVHAQASGQTLEGCQISNGGGGDSVCSQYLVQVNTRRGVPKFQVWQVQSYPVLVDGTNNTSRFVNYGVGSSVSVQAFELATGTQAFTLTASEP